MLDTTLVEMLQCPVTHSKLRLEGDYLISEIGPLKYPIIDGIPVLLPDRAILPEGCKTLEEFKERCSPKKPEAGSQ
jgi:uncharacterized protein